MIEKKCAEEIRQLSLRAISDLSKILDISKDRCSQEKYEKIKKGVGVSIGKIQENVLDLIDADFPELDDLK